MSLCFHALFTFPYFPLIPRHKSSYFVLSLIFAACLAPVKRNQSVRSSSSVRSTGSLNKSSSVRLNASLRQRCSKNTGKAHRLIPMASPVCVSLVQRKKTRKYFFCLNLNHNAETNLNPPSKSGRRIWRATRNQTGWTIIASVSILSTSHWWWFI